MSVWKGTISKVSSTKWGNKTLHSFQIEGTQRWFKTGQNPVPYNEGDQVVFEEKNGKVEFTTAEAIKATQSAPLNVAADATGTSTGVVGATPTISRDQYWARREQRDIETERKRRIAAARHDAARIVCAALAHNHLPHSDNTAKGKRLDLLLGYVNEVTNTLLEGEDEV